MFLAGTATSYAQRAPLQWQEELLDLEEDQAAGRARTRAPRGPADAVGGLLPGRSPRGHELELRRGGARPRRGDLLSPAGRRRGAPTRVVRPLCPRGHWRGRRTADDRREGLKREVGTGFLDLFERDASPPPPGAWRRTPRRWSRPPPSTTWCSRAWASRPASWPCSNCWRIAARGYAGSSWCCATSAGTSASGPACWSAAGEARSSARRRRRRLQAVEVWGEAVPRTRARARAAGAPSPS